MWPPRPCWTSLPFLDAIVGFHAQFSAADFVAGPWPMRYRFMVCLMARGISS